MSRFWACAVRHTRFRKLIARESKRWQASCFLLPHIKKKSLLQKIMTPIGFFLNIRQTLFQKVFVETMCQLPAQPKQSEPGRWETARPVLSRQRQLMHSIKCPNTRHIVLLYNCPHFYWARFPFNKDRDRKTLTSFRFRLCCPVGTIFDGCRWFRSTATGSAIKRHRHWT